MFHPSACGGLAIIGCILLGVSHHGYRLTGAVFRKFYRPLLGCQSNHVTFTPYKHKIVNNLEGKVSEWRSHYFVLSSPTNFPFPTTWNPNPTKSRGWKDECELSVKEASLLSFLHGSGFEVVDGLQAVNGFLNSSCYMLSPWRFPNFPNFDSNHFDDFLRRIDVSRDEVNAVEAVCVKIRPLTSMVPQLPLGEELFDHLVGTVDVENLNFPSYDEELLDEVNQQFEAHGNQDSEVEGPHQSLGLLEERTTSNPVADDETIGDNLITLGNRPINVVVEFDAAMGTSHAFQEKVPTTYKEVHNEAHSVDGANSSIMKVFENLPRSLGKLPFSSPDAMVLEFFGHGLTQYVNNLSESHNTFTDRKAMEMELEALKIEVRKLREKEEEMATKIKNLIDEKAILSTQEAKWKRSYEESLASLKIAISAKTSTEATLSEVAAREKKALGLLESKNQEIIKLEGEKRGAKLKGLGLVQKTLDRAAGIAKKYGHIEAVEEISKIYSFQGNKPCLESARPEESSPSSRKRIEMS